MIPVLGGTNMTHSGYKSDHAWSPQSHHHQTHSQENSTLMAKEDELRFDPNKEASERDTWGKKIDFFLALVGFSVGLGNVWRFPYLCYKNGGGAFLIPYLICVVIGGVPLLILEISLGQFMAQGGIKAWAICPVFQGIGWATTTIIFFVNSYYNVILAWATFYFFSSFTTKLPWDTCNNYWNTQFCYDKYFLINPSVNEGIVNFTGNQSEILAYWNNNQTKYMEPTAAITTKFIPIRIDPVTEFWENNVLDISNGIADVGRIKWDICLCLLLSWIVICVCISKGVKSSGKLSNNIFDSFRYDNFGSLFVLTTGRCLYEKKTSIFSQYVSLSVAQVVYFTATAPYALMFVLLIRGCTLPGAREGIKFYMIPDFKKVLTVQVWVDAGTQVFFSYAIGIGGLTALGSYNTWNHNSYRDAVLFSMVNSGTSLFAGFVIFSVLGFMAKEAGVDVASVAESGPGLAFVAYPKAVSQMPIAPLWSILFFFMIILLGLDSQFVGVEGIVTAVQDTFPTLRKTWQRRTCFVATTVFIHFLVGLSMVTRGGMYVFQLFDYYPGSRIIVLIGFFECITVAWFYGVNRYSDNLEMMYGFKINIWMKICWMVLTPMYCLVIFIMSTVNYSGLTYKRPSGTYIYPTWTVGIGWILAVIPIILMALTGIYKLIVCLKEGKDLRTLIQPAGLKPHQLRPQDRLDYEDSPPHYLKLGSLSNNTTSLNTTKC